MPDFVLKIPKNVDLMPLLVVCKALGVKIETIEPVETGNPSWRVRCANIEESVEETK